MRRLLSRSRFSRRVNRLADLIYRLFHQSDSVLKQLHWESRYLLDSFPVPVCDNIRIKRCRIVGDKLYRGAMTSFRRYFYGIRVSILTTSDGIPVEFCILPEACSDLQGLAELALDYSPRNTLVYRHWSGKQKAVASGIYPITLLWTDDERCVPVNYRIFDKDTDGKTKNDHFAEMLMSAFERGFNTQLVCFESWYGLIENLKLVHTLGWHFLTRMKSNRQINVNRTGLQAISAATFEASGQIVWLTGFGEVKVSCVIVTDGMVEHWATSLSR